MICVKNANKTVKNVYNVKIRHLFEHNLILVLIVKEFKYNFIYKWKFNTIIYLLRQLNNKY